MADDGRTSDDSILASVLMPPPPPRRRRRHKRRHREQSSSSTSDNDDTTANSNLNDDNVSSSRCCSAAATTATNTTTSSRGSNSNCNALDAELENHVNQLMSLQCNNRHHHPMKKKRRETTLSSPPSSVNDTNLATNYDCCVDHKEEKEKVNMPITSNNDNNQIMSNSLPILLHIREVGGGGLSSRILFGRYHKQRTMSLLLHQHHPPSIYYTRRNERRDKQQQQHHQQVHRHHQQQQQQQQQRDDGGFQLETTTSAASNNNNHYNDGDDDDHSNNITRRLRVPVCNQHALHLQQLQQQQNDDDDNNNNNRFQQEEEDPKTSPNHTTTMLLPPPYNKRKTYYYWRPYTRRTIQFSQLKTPHSVAILAMDQWGGYSIGVAADTAAAAAANDGNWYSGHDERGRRRDVSISLLSLQRPSLSLKFYGIPSPARLVLRSSSGSRHLSSSPTLSSSSSSVMISPLAHSIPMLLNNRQYNNSSSSNNNSLESDEEDDLVPYSPIVQVRDTPIQIILCSNGAFGVGYVLDSRMGDALSSPPLRCDLFSRSPALQDDFMGALVIFETPRDGLRTITKSFHCSNVRIGGWKSFTMRNALWPTMYVPVVKSNTRRGGSDGDRQCSSSLLFDTNVLSAYMLFNDEDDGFRITWIIPFKEGGGVDCAATSKQHISLPSHKIQAARNDIVVVTNEHETWEECLSDPHTGLIHQRSDNNDTTDDSSLDIPYEVYLHIDALLLDILARRQQTSSMFKMSPYQSDTVRFIPNFYYNLISVSEDGLDVTLVIVFSNKEKMMMQSSSSSQLPPSTKRKLPSALGVVINFGIFNQMYDELKWVQHPSCDDDSSMKQWCNSLALNWRMKECGIGVFCLERSMMKNETWVGKTHERNVDEDLEDDYNIDIWSRYFIQKEEAKRAKNRLTVAPPKDISMSSLYPHCDVITNRAVYDAIPVKRISSRKSPNDFIYG